MLIYFNDPQSFVDDHTNPPFEFGPWHHGGDAWIANEWCELGAKARTRCWALQLPAAEWGAAATLRKPHFEMGTACLPHAVVGAVLVLEKHQKESS